MTREEKIELSRRRQREANIVGEWVHRHWNTVGQIPIEEYLDLVEQTFPTFDIAHIRSKWEGLLD